jgi:hypothetical protein
MQLIRTRNDALGNRVIARNDDVIAGKIQLLNRERHKAKILTVLRLCERKSLYEGRPNALVENMQSVNVGQEVDQTE